MSRFVRKNIYEHVKENADGDRGDDQIRGHTIAEISDIHKKWLVSQDI